jgi:hypothetical protein
MYHNQDESAIRRKLFSGEKQLNKLSSPVIREKEPKHKEHKGSQGKTEA